MDEKNRYRNLSSPGWRDMTTPERALAVSLWAFLAFVLVMAVGWFGGFIPIT